MIIQLLYGTFGSRLIWRLIGRLHLTFLPWSRLNSWICIFCCCIDNTLGRFLCWPSKLPCPFDTPPDLDSVEVCLIQSWKSQNIFCGNSADRNRHIWLCIWAFRKDNIICWKVLLYFPLLSIHAPLSQYIQAAFSPVFVLSFMIFSSASWTDLKMERNYLR